MLSGSAVAIDLRPSDTTHAVIFRRRPDGPAPALARETRCVETVCRLSLICSMLGNRQTIVVVVVVVPAIVPHMSFLPSLPSAMYTPFGSLLNLIQQMSCRAATCAQDPKWTPCG
eukprot:PhF_6_TR44202/c2_g1_i2/m.67834